MDDQGKVTLLVNRILSERMVIIFVYNETTNIDYTVIFVLILPNFCFVFNVTRSYNVSLKNLLLVFC